jgi:hypothetical protein
VIKRTRLVVDYLGLHRVPRPVLIESELEPWLLTYTSPVFELIAIPHGWSPISEVLAVQLPVSGPLTGP